VGWLGDHAGGTEPGVRFIGSVIWFLRSGHWCMETGSRVWNERANDLLDFPERKVKVP